MYCFSKHKNSTFYFPGQEIFLAGRGTLSWKNRDVALQQEKGRALCVIGSFLFAFCILAGKFFSVYSGASVVVAEKENKIISLDIKMERADITDRNGILLATSLPSVDLYADVSKIKNAETIAAALVQTLPDLSYKTVLKKLKSKKKFVYLKRQLTPTEQYEINRLGFPALNFENNEIRVYPQGALFSHLIGRTNIDNKGISGLEKTLNKKLSEEKENIRLSLDVGVQNSIRTILKQTVDEHQAQGAAAVLMNAKTAQVVAMVSLPDFDPNKSVGAQNAAQFNSASLGVYELGSVMKLFNTAIGLETKKFRVSDTFDASEPLVLVNHKITDEPSLRRTLSLPEILIHSSNIGSAQIALGVGAEKQRQYLEKFGFFDPLRITLPEKGQPIYPSKWRESNTATVSYGYGLSVTPLHVTAAAAALVNGGKYAVPNFFADVNEEKIPAKRIISKKTSDIMRAMMRMVVLKGTGRRANVAGYEVGGKTGSARKVVKGKYAEDNVRTSFLSAFPMDNPEYVLMVMIDSPKKSKATHFQNNAAWNAVPAAEKIISAVAPQLGITPRPYEPSQSAPYVRRILAQ